MTGVSSELVNIRRLNSIFFIGCAVKVRIYVIVPSHHLHEIVYASFKCVMAVFSRREP